MTIVRDVPGGITRGCGLLLVASLTACSVGPPAPARLDPANDTCAHCRMAVSDKRFAAQIARRGEEPIFFDDIGCLRDYLRESRPNGDAVAFVADHRTGEWVAGGRAVYSRRPSLATPMASGLVAHADSASRDRDPEAAGAEPVPAVEILGPLARGGR